MELGVVSSSFGTVLEHFRIKDGTAQEAFLIFSGILLVVLPVFLDEKLNQFLFELETFAYTFFVAQLWPQLVQVAEHASHRGDVRF